MSMNRYLGNDMLLSASCHTDQCALDSCASSFSIEKSRTWCLYLLSHIIRSSCRSCVKVLDCLPRVFFRGRCHRICLLYLNFKTFHNELLICQCLENKSRSDWHTYTLVGKTKSYQHFPYFFLGFTPNIFLKILKSGIQATKFFYTYTVIDFQNFAHIHPPEYARQQEYYRWPFCILNQLVTSHNFACSQKWTGHQQKRDAR